MASLVRTTIKCKVRNGKYICHVSISVSYIHVMVFMAYTYSNPENITKGKGHEMAPLVQTCGWVSVECRLVVK